MKRIALLLGAMAGLCQGQMQWTNRDSRTALVQPAEPTVLQFVVDPTPAGGDTFDVACDDARAVVTLILPGGMEISQGNAEPQGYWFDRLDSAAFRSALIPNPLASAGMHTLIRLPASAVPGEYGLRIDASAAGGPVAVVASYVSSTAVMATVAAGDAVGQVGRTVGFTGFVREGGKALENLTAKLTLRNESVASAPVVIDMQRVPVGEGTLLGVWRPQTEGVYTVAMRVSGMASTGIAFSRIASTSLRVFPSMAKLVGLRDAAVDENADGKIESVSLMAALEVAKAGRYRLGVSLAGQGETMVTTSAVAALESGRRELRIRLTGAEMAPLGGDGPYAIRDLVLTSADLAEPTPLEVRADAGRTAAYRLSEINSGAAGMVRVSPIALNFASTPVGSASEQMLTLRNESAAPIEEAVATVSGAMFTVATPFTIPAGGEFRVAVRYLPTAAGSHNATLTIAGQRVTLTGTASAATVSAVTVTPMSLEFGATTVGQSKELTCVIRNGGTGVAAIGSLRVNGAPFMVVSPVGEISLAAGASQTITVRYRPEGVGSHTGLLNVGSLTVALAGSGVGAPSGGWSITPTTLDFGKVGFGEIKTLTMTLNNSLAVALVVTSAVFSKVGFSLTSPAVPATIAAGASQAFVIRLSMLQTTDMAASLRIVTNDPAKPFVEIPITVLAK
jgi:hypothetical protein